MKASGVAISLIKRYEDLHLNAYRDVGDKWTIGYGQTGPHVGPGLKITKLEAEEWLKNHVALLQDQISELVKTKLTQNQFDALACLVYNVGITAFRHSKMLKRLNQGLPHEAAKEFLDWDHVNGVKVPGLTRRRQEEYRLFQG